jgi:hypothetical protein
MKRPGRPRVDPDALSVYVSVTLTAAQYDALCKKALQLDVSIPEMIRRELDKQRKTPPR